MDFMGLSSGLFYSLHYIYMILGESLLAKKTLGQSKSPNIWSRWMLLLELPAERPGVQ